MLLFGGIPVFVMEVALGQYMSRGGLHAWDICPLFKGMYYNLKVKILSYKYIRKLSFVRTEKTPTQ